MQVQRTQKPNRAYYVTVRNDRGQTAFVLGPFKTHKRALGLVTAARRHIVQAGADPFHAFGYGTSSVPMSRSLPAGKLNGSLNIMSEIAS